MNKIIPLIICITIPLAVGGIAGFATSSSIDSWYSELEKPTFNPPNYIFGPVWSILYILMGISLFLLWKSKRDKNRRKGLIVFFIQLVLNFAWSFIFFYFHQIAFAFIEILVLWIAILMLLYYLKKTTKPGFYLQIPYLIWVTFASILNGAILSLNA